MCPCQTVLAEIFHYTETTFQPRIQLECQGHESSQAYVLSDSAQKPQVLLLHSLICFKQSYQLTSVIQGLVYIEE